MLSVSPETVLTPVISPRATEQMHPENLMLFVDIVTQKTDAEGLHKLKESVALSGIV